MDEECTTKPETAAKDGGSKALQAATKAGKNKTTSEPGNSAGPKVAKNGINNEQTQAKTSRKKPASSQFPIPLEPPRLTVAKASDPHKTYPKGKAPWEKEEATKKAVADGTAQEATRKSSRVAEKSNGAEKTPSRSARISKVPPQKRGMKTAVEATERQTGQDAVRRKQKSEETPEPGKRTVQLAASSEEMSSDEDDVVRPGARRLLRQKRIASQNEAIKTTQAEGTASEDEDGSKRSKGKQVRQRAAARRVTRAVSSASKTNNAETAKSEAGKATKVSSKEKNDLTGEARKTTKVAPMTPVEHHSSSEKRPSEEPEEEDTRRRKSPRLGEKANTSASGAAPSMVGKGKDEQPQQQKPIPITRENLYKAGKVPKRKPRENETPPPKRKPSTTVRKLRKIDLEPEPPIRMKRATNGKMATKEEKSKRSDGTGARVGSWDKVSSRRSTSRRAGKPGKD